MEKWQIIGLLVAGVVLLVGSLLLRVVAKGKYEIKTTDLVFILVPLLFVGLATGKLRGLDMFGVKADLSELWTKAAGTEIEKQVSTIPALAVDDAVETFYPEAKGAVTEIPRMIRERTQALAFRLGAGIYYAPTIRKYFDDLHGSSYLRFVVINNNDNSFFGMYEAGDLIAYLRTLGDMGYDRFEVELNRGDGNAKSWLTELPGFISTDQAVTFDTTKREALMAMEVDKLDSLPVVDEPGGNFVGTVERAKLTSGLILAVTEKLEGKKTAEAE